MTTSFRLNETDLKEAIELWIATKDRRPELRQWISSRPTFNPMPTAPRIYLGVDPGDPPLSGPTIYATAFFEVNT